MAGIFLPDDAGQQALKTAFQSGTLENFTVQLPKGPGQTTSGNLYAFSGYVQEFPAPDVQFDKVVNFKCHDQADHRYHTHSGELITHAESHFAGGHFADRRLLF